MGWAERGAGALQEPPFALGAPQRIGTHHANTVGAHGAQPLTESLQTAQGAFGSVVIEPASVAETGGKAHHFTQSIEG